MNNWAEILQLAREHAHKTGQRPYVFGAPDGRHWRYFFCRHDVHRSQPQCPYREAIFRRQRAQDR